MARLEIEGRLVEVDDSFLALSPADQERTVDEIAAAFAPKSAPALPSSMEGFMPPDTPGLIDTPAPSVAAPKPSDRPGYLEDIAKAVPSGFARGAAGIMGLPHFISGIADWGAALPGRTYNKLFGTGRFEDNELMKEGLALQKGKLSLEPPSAPQLVAGLESVTGPLYQPKTVPGQFAGTLAEFSAGAPLTTGSALARVGQVVAPALLSESAGQLAKGSDLEPHARIAGALVGGIGAGMAGRSSAVEKTVARGLKDVTVNQVDDAERLFVQAQEMGLPITRAEALAQATGGQTRMNDLQRLAEGQGALHGFMAKRPAQVEAAGRRALDDIAPVPSNPSMTGSQVGKAAEGIVNEARGIINNATAPLYDMAARVRIPPSEMSRLRAAPGWPEAISAVRNDPQLARYVKGLPDDSVGVANEVKKYLETQAKNTSAPVNAQANMQRSAGYGADADLVRDAAMEASPWYRGALAQQTELRTKYLDPLLAGPIGKIAQHDITTQSAINALFPKNPLPGSQKEISSAVGALAAKSKQAAQQLVRAHVESTFNAATRELQAGANQFGGASFVAQLKGNAQAAQNLEAAVTALHGPKAWQGFEKMLDIMQATGQRQRVGTYTSFNDQMISEMKGTGLARGVAQTATGGFTMLPRKVMDTFDSWNLGRNTEKLAELLTDRNSAVLFRGLADSKSDKNIQLFLTRMVGAKEATDARPLPSAVGR